MKRAGPSTPSTLRHRDGSRRGGRQRHALRGLLAVWCLSTTTQAQEGFAPAAKAEPARLVQARRNAEAEVRETFRRAQVSYPPGEIFLRAIKDEDALELWAASVRGRPMTRIKTFRICMRSGQPGPKREQGDGQVPEGFYRVGRFNPWSTFHLSLGIDYPNSSDRLRKTGPSPGGDIFIHGGCATIGCLPLENGPMEQLYVIATDARAHGQREIGVHLFPTRLEAAWLAALEADPAVPAELRSFWRELGPGFQAFEATRRPPRVGIDPRSGAYRLSVARGTPRPGQSARP